MLNGLLQRLELNVVEGQGSGGGGGCVLVLLV